MMKAIRTAARAEKQQALALAEWNLARLEAGEANAKMSPAQAKTAIETARKAPVKTKDQNTATRKP